MRQNKTSSSTFNQHSINNVIKYKRPDVEGFLFDQLKLQSQSTNVIRTYLVEKPVPQSRFIFEAMKENTDWELNKTALRQLLYHNKDLETSFSLINENSKMFEAKEIKNLQKLGLLYFGGVLSFNGLLEIVIVGHEAIHLLFDVYFFNMFFLIFFLKKFNSDTVTWRPGTSFFQKYFRRYDYKMCDKLLAVYKELYTTTVSNYHMTNSKIIKEFQKDMDFDKEEMDRLVSYEFRKLGLMVTEDSHEAMFKEYWSTGGEGFEWAEPDKDPVDFLVISPKKS